MRSSMNKEPSVSRIAGPINVLGLGVAGALLPVSPMRVAPSQRPNPMRISGQKSPISKSRLVDNKETQNQAKDPADVDDPQNQENENSHVREALCILA